MSFIRRVVDRLRRAALGIDDRRADVWERDVYEHFGAAHRKIPVRMDFTAIERPWLREVVKEVAWVRMARQGVGPTSAHRTLIHTAHFERWAGERLDRGHCPTASAACRSSRTARTPTLATRVRTFSRTSATGRCSKGSSRAPSNASTTPSAPAISDWRRSTAPTCLDLRRIIAGLDRLSE